MKHTSASEDQTDSVGSREALTKETLNNKCPFGYYSTKHFSADGHAPDIQKAKDANVIIKEALDSFVEHIKSSPRMWKPISISAFTWAADRSYALHDNMPSSFDEVFPIPLRRNGQSIIKYLGDKADDVDNVLCSLHLAQYDIYKSHAKTAKQVIAGLRKELIGTPHSEQSSLKAEFKSLGDLICADKRATIDLDNPDKFVGIPVTLSVFKSLVAYQNIQERFESVEQVSRTNDLIQRRPDLLETILGIQWELCQQLEKYAANDPKIYAYSRAYSEIGLFGPGATEVIPSSRFLKVILHNWGSYFLEVSEKGSGQMLTHAAQRALQDQVYFQNIFVFRTDSDTTKLHGIIPKVCPARCSIGRLVGHYAANIT